MNTYVTLRGSIYVTLAMLTAFSGWLNEIIAEKTVTLTWLEWAAMGVSVVTAGLLALRAFIDGSAERSRQNGNK
jgi:uncharacterized membrane protein YdbT with pleckstrin-like domain